MPFGLATITGGMFALTRVDGDTSYWGYLIPVLFIMGLGMGATMMPLMTSALKTLTAHQVARGSTLLNITQQVASSLGVAIISVVLTNGLKNDPLVSQASGFAEASKGVDPSQTGALLERFPLVGQILSQFQDPAAGAAALGNAVRNASGEVFGSTFLVAAIMVAFTLVSAAFLPRKREESHLLDDENAEDVAPPVLLH